MPLIMKYFVLKPLGKSKNDQFARASRIAMKAFSKSIRKTDPRLADELDYWVLETEAFSNIPQSGIGR